MRAAALIIGLIALVPGALAQENYESWRLHTPKFPSTGGGGIIIGEYNPVIVGDKCKTDFTATEPNGTVYYNSVEFDAVPAQGGVLCHNGRGVRATAARPEPRPTGCSSRTAWCAVRRSGRTRHGLVEGSPRRRRRRAAMRRPAGVRFCMDGQAVLERRHVGVTVVVAGASALPTLLLRPALLEEPLVVTAPAPTSTAPVVAKVEPVAKPVEPSPQVTQRPLPKPNQFKRLRRRLRRGRLKRFSRRRRNSQPPLPGTAGPRAGRTSQRRGHVPAGAADRRRHTGSGPVRRRPSTPGERKARGGQAGRPEGQAEKTRMTPAGRQGAQAGVRPASIRCANSSPGGARVPSQTPVVAWRSMPKIPACVPASSYRRSATLCWCACAARHAKTHRRHRPADHGRSGAAREARTRRKTREREAAGLGPAGRAERAPTATRGADQAARRRRRTTAGRRASRRGQIQLRRGSRPTTRSPRSSIRPRSRCCSTCPTCRAGIRRRIRPTVAKLSDDERATFRARLRKCWKLPAGIARPGDARGAAHLSAPRRDACGRSGADRGQCLARRAGRLQAAMRTLKDCQPFAFLPADKYGEWKVLDLSFTPREMAGG